MLVDPKDPENVYVYISGASQVRSPHELPGCVAAAPSEDPNSSLFRIEVIKVPVAHPEQAAIVSSPRIFHDLVAPPKHGETPQDIAESKRAADSARAAGAFTAVIDSQSIIIPDNFADEMLSAEVAARGGSGAPTAADSAALRPKVQAIVDSLVGKPVRDASGQLAGPTQCHDITVYPGHRPGRRGLRRVRAAARHQRSGQPEAHRRRVRLQLLLLALGDVQQRRDQDPVQRRVGRRRAAQVPEDRQARVGRRRDLHA